MIVCENYTLTNGWQNDFRHPKAASNASPAFIRIGRCLNVQRETGLDKQHYFIASPEQWMEKLFPYRQHSFLHIRQFEVLKRLKIPHEFDKYKNIQWMYMTLHESMRDKTFHIALTCTFFDYLTSVV